jgi:hypothetical protein
MPSRCTSFPKSAFTTSICIPCLFSPPNALPLSRERYRDLFDAPDLGCRSSAAAAPWQPVVKRRRGR